MLKNKLRDGKTYEKNLKKLLIACMNCTFSVSSIMSTENTVISLAHSGRTDSSGGHRDNKNKSGLGYYHCGGHPAHLHKNGCCPYRTSVSSKKNKTLRLARLQLKLYKKS